MASKVGYGTLAVFAALATTTEAFGFGKPKDGDYTCPKNWQYSETTAYHQLFDDSVFWTCTAKGSILHRCPKLAEFNTDTHRCEYPKDLHNDLAPRLSAEWSLEKNYPGPITNFTSWQGADDGFVSNMTLALTYTSSESYTEDWALYFHFIRRVLGSQDPRFNVVQVTGDLHKITPTKLFEGFLITKVGAIYIPLVTEYWMMFETDFFPRLFVVDHKGIADVIHNTNTMSINKYSNPVTAVQFNEAIGHGQNTMVTGPIRYYNNRNIKIADVSTNIIPTPLSTVVVTGQFADLTNGVFISGKLPEGQVAALYMRFKTLGFKISKGGYEIRVAVDSTQIPAAAKKADGYMIQITNTHTTINSFDVAGGFYAVQSFLALITVGSNQVPAVTIYDAPRFAYRAQHADIARNFQQMSTLKRTLDQMAAYKMNKFLLHASDDEGWRIEIPGLPELTELGSRRCFDPTETMCLVPQLGSGPSSNNAGTGYIPYQDYIDLVSYANDRNIEIIPEFDMPGHARAAVVSMELRFNRTGDSTYRLVDPKDTTKLATVQYFNRLSLLNPCQPSVINFVTKVMGEISFAHFRGNRNLTRWSFGGDEAKNAIKDIHNIAIIPPTMSGDVPIWNINNTVGPAPLWREQTDAPFAGSPICQAYMKKNNIKSSAAMTGDLAMRVSEVAKMYNIKHFQSWEDALMTINNTQMSVPTIGMDWDALFWGSNFHTLAQKGFKVVSAQADFNYFDQPYEQNPNNRGLYWASVGTSVFKVFSFAPVNIPQNAEVGRSRTNTTFSLPSPSLGKNNTAEDVVIGLQGNVWTETVWADRFFDYMLFPRMLALAERAWHKGGFELDYTEGRTFTGGKTNFVNMTLLQEEYNTFINIVGNRELAKLEAAGVFYRVPSLGAFVEDGILKTNSEVPDVYLEYSLDYTNNWTRVLGGEKMTAPRFIVRPMSSNRSRHGVVELFKCISTTTNVTLNTCIESGCSSKSCSYVNTPLVVGVPACKSLNPLVTDFWCRQHHCIDLGVKCQWITE